MTIASFHRLDPSVTKLTEYLADPDTPAGLALALRQIRSAAAIYLLRVKGFRRSQNWRAVRTSEEDRSLGGHGYFLAVAWAFDEFIGPDEQTRKQRAAVRAIHHAYGALLELNLAGQSMPDKVGAAFNWAPPTFDVMSGEVLARVIGWSTRAFFWGGDFMLVSVSAKAGGDARAPYLGKPVNCDWESLFLSAARAACRAGRFTQSTLYDKVRDRLDPSVILPEFKKVQLRMTEWERADPAAYERIAPDGRRTYRRR
jgi:hypothetical protein